MKPPALSALFEAYLDEYFESQNVLYLHNMHATILKAVEKPLITLILQKTCYNQSKTAEILGLNRNTLRKKMDELGIKIKHESKPS
ncbi:MAG: helix-turn-helix domain-containing protein [Alphaproteobacteria bacterium]